MEPLTCRSMALILFRYSYSNWLKIFPAFHSPELKSVQTIRIVSSIITFAVLFKTIQNYFSFFFLWIFCIINLRQLYVKLWLFDELVY